MPNIFISYAKEDRERTAAVAKALGNLGWQVFWDRDIPPGKTWDEVIEKAIEAAGCMLVLWSANSVASEWVRAEAEEGLQRKILIPVLIEKAKIPLRFRPLQAASLIDWREDPSHLGFKQLVQAIAQIIGGLPPREKQGASKSEAEVIADAQLLTTVFGREFTPDPTTLFPGWWRASMDAFGEIQATYDLQLRENGQVEGEGGVTQGGVASQLAENMGMGGLLTMRIQVHGSWSYDRGMQILTLMLSASGFGQQTDDTVTIRITGREKGAISGQDLAGRKWILRRAGESTIAGDDARR